MTLYAKTAFIPATRTTITFNSVIPYFTKPQLGASAYTAILREYVEANAAHNAVNNVVYPVEDQLAGPFMGPQAPDVVTQSNCPKCELATEPPIVPETQPVGYTEAPSGPTPNTGVVTTLAGDGTEGFADGTGAGAQFNRPRGVAIAPDGTIVVADASNHRIRRITPEGVVTTVAGSSQGSADGTGAAAMFNFPSSVALLPNGVIVVADQGNHRIRLVTPEGVVSTLAGSTFGYLDGIGAAARFSNPFGVAVLPNSLIVVSDSGNQLIRLVTLAGVVTTLAGSQSTFGGYADGTGSAAQFSIPNGIAVLPSSSLIAVGDASNQRIRLVSPTGIVTTLAGSGLGGFSGQFADGIGTAASFARPNGVAVVPSSGAIVVGDTENHRIRVIAGAF